MKAVYLLTAAAFLTLLFGADRAFSEGNATRGQRVFGACAACHSLQPDQSMTGPSLAELWNRKAGSLASFSRYSPALKSANIVWNDKTLDDWITNPQHLVPGNEMTFDGIKDAPQRADLLAFLKQATQPGASVAQGGQMGGMGGMMGGGRVPTSTLAADADSNGGAGVKLEFRRIVVWPGGREEIENVTPKQLPSPDAASPTLPRPTDPTDDTNEGAVR